MLVFDVAPMLANNLFVISLSCELFLRTSINSSGLKASDVSWSPTRMINRAEKGSQWEESVPWSVPYEDGALAMIRNKFYFNIPLAKCSVTEGNIKATLLLRC